MKTCPLNVAPSCLLLPRITNLQSAAKPQVQLRIKTSQTPGERLSQSKSMVLQESDLPPKPVSTDSADLLCSLLLMFNI